MIRMRSLAGTLACLLAAAPLPAQSDTAITLARGSSLVQAGKPAEAIEVLTTLTAREPGNGRAWHLLGLAYLSLKQYPAALEAHLRAATISQTRPAGLYNAGVTYALLSQPDSAFAYLFRAKETGRMDLTRILADSHAVSLRSDPRYRRLLPTAEEFERPFVEAVTILGEWRGEAAGDQFGWIARSAGDLDADGVLDFVTSAPSHGSEGSNAGKVYAYSTRTKRLLWSRTGSSGDRLGTGIEAAGDVNHDGVADVISGAPGADAAYIYSGRDGTTLRTLTPETRGDWFGRSVSDAGDANRDGFDDVLVGASRNDARGEDAGRAYLFSGRDGSILLTLSGEQPGDLFGSTVAGATVNGTTWIVVGAPGAGQRRTGRTYVYTGLSPTPAFVAESDSTGAALGAMFVSVVGDVNRDGTPDIYSSDFTNAANGPSTGRVYVYSGRDGSPLLTLTGEGTGNGFGIGPADAGDVNGDGYDDLAVGAWQFGGAAPSGGKIYVLSGRDGTRLRTITGQVPGETLGFDSTGLGDVNGDGVPDLLVTSAWSAINGYHSGRVFVISGK